MSSGRSSSGPTRWLDLRLDQLWRYRDLVMPLYGATSLPSISRRSWATLAHYPAALTTLTFTVIFGRVAQLPTDGSAAVPLLYGWHGHLELFRRLRHHHIRYLYSKRRHFWQAVLPRLVMPIRTTRS